ncbi:MIP family channel protein [Ceraceosorus guamensis]|uniref:MIP family channel protein n=1 Tax=Ceraceosorus guamensis TaxID=1522189 RepID=A0A316WCD2_9BASI|nr:MIP family channel protein [Ceraceosorus guamensis]PWN45533.1 MIP family channel protein [Ceraceosorus guamensis]
MSQVRQTMSREPLLPQSQPAAAVGAGGAGAGVTSSDMSRRQSSSSSSRRSFRDARRSEIRNSLNRSGFSNVNGALADTEPMLPAAPVPAHLDTDTHDPRWAERNGKANKIQQFRYVWREELGEFLGAAMIILFGCGVECQVQLHMGLGSGPDAAKSLISRFAWATGVAVGIWTSGGVSGAHLNPTVTIALAVFRGFPARRVPWFIASQILGCAAAALLIYANYYYSISLYEGGQHIRSVTGPHSTAGLFFTFPYDILPWTSAAYSEFLASAVLVAVVFALSDQANLPPPTGLMPLAMWIVLVGIGAALGINTGYAMNLARDSGPRLACWLVGYGNEVWTNNHFYFAWGPGLSAILGGLAGGAIYDLLIYTGQDSPLNRPVGGHDNPLYEQVVIDEE